MISKLPPPPDMDEGRWKLLYAESIKHAIDYKHLFHDMQDAYFAASAESIKRGKTIERQAQIIAALERRLGIDDEL